MAVIALIAMIASFTWLGILVVDRKRATRVEPTPSALHADVTKPTSETLNTDGRTVASDAEQPGAPQVVGAIIERASAEPRASPVSDTASSAEIGKPAEPSSASSDAQNVRASNESTNETASMASSAHDERPAQGARGREAFDAKSHASSDTATIPAPVSQDSRPRVSVRDSRSSAARQRNVSVRQQQWTLLSPPSSAPRIEPAPTSRTTGTFQGPRATRATNGPPGTAQRASSQPDHDANSAPEHSDSTSGPYPPTQREDAVNARSDADPVRRDRWLREQLQLR